MLFGYARVSTADQNPDHQHDALRKAGVAEENIHTDYASGAKASRPEWDILVGQVTANGERAGGRLRKGDTLVATRLDRIGRSLLHLVNLGASLREQGVELRILEQGIDTSTPEGRAMYGMLAVLAELQREFILANTRDGLAAARARGRVGGRKPRLTRAQAELAQQRYDEVGADGMRRWTVQEIADLIGAPRSTVYGYLKTNGATAPPSTER